MFKRIFLASVIIVFSVTSGCDKKDKIAPTTSIGTDFFIEGKGVRKIWGSKTSRDGSGAFYLAHLTYTPDDILHTIFEYAGNTPGGPVYRTFYRKKININTGDTIATKGIPLTNISSTIAEDNGTRVLVPYTDILTWIEGTTAMQSINGEYSWLPISGFQGGNFGGYSNFCKAKVYSTQQIAATGLQIHRINNLPYIWGRIYSNGNFISGQKVLGKETICASIELSPAGVPLTFVVQKTDSLQVFNFATNTLIASIKTPLFKQYIPSNYPSTYIPTANIITKRSHDGTKIIGLINHVGNYIANTTGVGSAYSTFIFDIASNTFTLKVQNAFIDQNEYTANCLDFDTDGNIYYINTPFNKNGQINKISPSGITVYRSDFYTNSSKIICMKSVLDKLFVVLNKSNQNPKSVDDDPKRGAILITVCE